MSRATPDDQLKFLLSCVRHSNNGKIDFVEVAHECGVVSKGAAAKRYERLLKANGIHPSGGPAERSYTPPSKQKSRADIAKSAAAKRRKIEGDAYDSKVDDDDEYGYMPHIKAEQSDMPHVKLEPGMRPIPFAYPYAVTHAQQPLFTRPAMPQARMTYPFPMPQMAMQQPSLPHIQSVPRFHPQPQAPGPLPEAMSAPIEPVNKQEATHRLQHVTATPDQAPVVPEYQIQLMFDEFCSQDMLKPSNFDTPPSDQSQPPISLTSSPTSAQQAQHSAGLPEGIDAKTTVLQTESAQIKEEEDAEKIVPTEPTPEPMGRGIDDSILIAD